MHSSNQQLMSQSLPALLSFSAIVFCQVSNEHVCCSAKYLLACLCSKIVNRVFL